MSTCQFGSLRRSATYWKTSAAVRAMTTGSNTGRPVEVAGSMPSERERTLPRSHSRVTGKRHSRVARHLGSAAMQATGFSYGSADTSRQLHDGL